MEDNRSKWSTSKTGNAYTLSKVTNLTEQEIKLFEKTLCPKFSNHDFVHRRVIGEAHFLRLIHLYNRTLKDNSGKNEQTLELTPLVVQKLFRSFATQSHEGQLFR